MFHVKHFAAKPFARHQYWLDNASAVKWSDNASAVKWSHRHGGIIVRWLDRHIWIDVAGRPNHAVFWLGQRLVCVFGGLGGIFWGSNEQFQAQPRREGRPRSQEAERRTV